MRRISFRFSILNCGLYAALLAGGLVSAYHPTLFSGFERMQADPGDTVLNHYILEHTWQWLTRADYVGTLWSPPFYHPTEGTLAYSENLFGVAPLYWLCRTALPPDLAFQVWMMLVSALTYLSAVAVFRAFGVMPVLSALGGYWFAFGLPRLVQIGHQQLIGHMFAPPALWCLWMFLRTPRTATLAGLAAAAFLQLMCSYYLGWFLVLGLVVFAAAYCFHDRATIGRIVAYARNHWPSAVTVLVISAVCVAGLMLPYIEANRGFRRQLFECLILLPRWNAWLAPGTFGPWAGPLRGISSGLVSEQFLFFGFVSLALVAVSAAALTFRCDRLGPARRRLAVACLLATAVLIVISLRGHGNFTIWTLICKSVPGSRAIRVGARIGGIVSLLAMTGGLLVLDGWLRRCRRPGLAVSTAAIVASLGIAEQICVHMPSFSKAEFAARVERVHEQLTPGVPAYVEIEPADSPILVIEQQLAAMWAGLRANTPVVNGYSGRYPTGYPNCLRPMTPEELTQWIDARQAGNVQVIRSESGTRLSLRTPHSELRADGAPWPNSPTKHEPAPGN